MKHLRDAFFLVRWWQRPRDWSLKNAAYVFRPCLWEKGQIAANPNERRFPSVVPVFLKEERAGAERLAVDIALHYFHTYQPGRPTNLKTGDFELHSGQPFIPQTVIPELVISEVDIPKGVYPKKGYPSELVKRPKTVRFLNP